MDNLEDRTMELEQYTTSDFLIPFKLARHLPSILRQNNKAILYSELICNGFSIGTQLGIYTLLIRYLLN